MTLILAPYLGRLPQFDRDRHQALAQRTVSGPAGELLTCERLIVTEGNYLLLDGGAWPRTRAAMDEVWFVTGDEQVRLERLVERHIAFGKRPDAARTWIEASDKPNAGLVAATMTRADRVVLNSAEGWLFVGVG